MLLIVIVHFVEVTSQLLPLDKPVLLTGCVANQALNFSNKKAYVLYIHLSVNRWYFKSSLASHKTFQLFFSCANKKKQRPVYNAREEDPPPDYVTAVLDDQMLRN